MGLATDDPLWSTLRSAPTGNTSVQRRPAPGVLRSGACPGRPAAADFRRTVHGGRNVNRRWGLTEELSPSVNGTHVSVTDLQAYLFKKAEGTASRLGPMSPMRMGNRNCSAVGVAAAEANGHAERRAALRPWPGLPGARPRLRRTTAMTPPTSSPVTASWGHAAFGVEEGRAAIEVCAMRHAGNQTSLEAHKRMEEACGGLKTVGGWRRIPPIDKAKLGGQALMCFATYTLVRRQRLRRVECA